MLGELKAGGRLEIVPAGRTITLLHPPGYDYFRLLRSKLHWGLGGLAHER
jgi:NAD+ kinase